MKLSLLFLWLSLLLLSHGSADGSNIFNICDSVLCERGGGGV